MDRKGTNTAASVRQRLLNRARSEGRAVQELATLYAMERFLYRLGRSPHAERFVLKGGLMTMTWAAEYARITRRAHQGAGCSWSGTSARGGGSAVASIQ